MASAIQVRVGLHRVGVEAGILSQIRPKAEVRGDNCAGCKKISLRERESIPGYCSTSDEGDDDDDEPNVYEAEDTMAASTALSTSPPDDPTNSQPTPTLVHRLKHCSSVLTLAVSNELACIFAGTQDGEIFVWSLSTFQRLAKFQAHKRSVLSLFLTPDTSLLISSAGDPLINVWCPRTYTRLYEIYSTYDVGDIFSVAYSPQHETVYVGAQNNTIQWVTLTDESVRVDHDSARHPDRRSHRFFDSKAVGGTSTPRRNDERWSLIPKSRTVLEIDSGAIRNFAHYGYVYCMLMATGPTVLVDSDEEVLISGGGDGTIKLWRLSSGSASESDDSGSEGEYAQGDGAIRELMVLGTDDGESVMSLAVDGSFLYAGKIEGIVELWDLDTKQKLRVMKAHRSDVMTLQMGWGRLWSAAATGSAAKHSTAHYGKYHEPSSASQGVNQKYQCLCRWKAHEGKILASAITTYRNDNFYITGANDDEVCVWKVSDKALQKDGSDGELEDIILARLREFVSFKTVSSRPEFAEDCHKGATFLGSLFKRMGGQVEMLSGADDSHNPVVLAKFAGKLEPAQKRKRVLFYGHYDVVGADTKKGKWQSDPFVMEGRNGYLYGRGVSDNKGPIIAALFAVTDLMQAKSLDNDIIFLIEGEEEAGSRGFQETVRRNKNLIGAIDYILLANSYWLDDEVPCLTYGLRGVLHATACVDSRLPDLHSGVDGSYLMDEPLSDLTSVLSKLKGPHNRVLIPGFYDNILPVTSTEESRYDEIASLLLRRSPEKGPLDRLKASLMARWREPNLTIHKYKVSGPDGSLVSSHANATFSLRLVPGQEIDVIVPMLAKYLGDEFAKLDSNNRFSLKIDNKAEPWLGDPTNEIFVTLEKAVMRAWTPAFADQSDQSSASPRPIAKETTSPETAAPKPKKPLYIREGGSIPAIRFLEKEFGAPAAHLPCGQASDSAHLDNERIRYLNLMKSREIIGEVFRRLGSDS